MIDQKEVEAFLYREALLLDEHQYDAWLSLWTEDAIYWVPAGLDDYDPTKRVSIIYDDIGRLRDRIDRLKSGAAWSQDPKSRLRHSITNILVESVAGDEVTVRSTLVLGELRQGTQTVYFAGQTHRLRRVGDGFRMACKKIVLLNNNEPIHNLTFLI